MVSRGPALAFGGGVASFYVRPTSLGLAKRGCADGTLVRQLLRSTGREGGPLANLSATDGSTEPPRGGWNQFDWFLVLALSAYIVAAARTAISYDSHLYLASAKSLFWPGMETWYHWIREPLYPALIRLSTGLFGSVDIGLVTVQTAAVVTAASVCFKEWFPTSPLLRRTGLLLTLANPIVIGFIGFVGQQAIFLALLCLSLAWVHRAKVPSSKRPKRFIAVSAALGAALVLLSATLLTVVMGIALHVFLSREDANPSHGRTVLARPPVVLTLAAVVALAGWWSYKAVVTSDTVSAYPYSEWIWDYSQSKSEFNAAEKLLALLSLGRDGTVPPSPVAWELTIYGGIDEAHGGRCGFEDPGDLAADYSEGYLEITCRPAWASAVNASLAPAGLVLHRISMLALVLSVAAAAIFRPARPFAVITIAYLAPYVVAAGISRYGVPLYPVGILLLLLGWEALRGPAGKRSTIRRLTQESGLDRSASQEEPAE